MNIIIIINFVCCSLKQKRRNREDLLEKSSREGLKQIETWSRETRQQTSHKLDHHNSDSIHFRLERMSEGLSNGMIMKIIKAIVKEIFNS